MSTSVLTRFSDFFLFENQSAAIEHDFQVQQKSSGKIIPPSRSSPFSDFSKPNAKQNQGTRVTAAEVAEQRQKQIAASIRMKIRRQKLSERVRAEEDQRRAAAQIKNLNERNLKSQDALVVELNASDNEDAERLRFKLQAEKIRLRKLNKKQIKRNRKLKDKLLTKLNKKTSNKSRNDG